MPAGVITALELQKRNKKRVNVFLDDEFAFGLPLEEAAKLHKGQVLTEADVQRLCTADEVGLAVDSAARFLSYRPRSIHEVRQNLSQKGIAEPTIESALERLDQLGYLNDRTFAEFWVRERSAFKPVSHKALRYELRQKGVPDEIIEDVLAAVDVSDMAYRAVVSHRRKVEGLSRRAMREKLLPVLLRRGFNVREVKDAVQRFIDTLELEGHHFADDEANDQRSAQTEFDE